MAIGFVLALLLLAWFWFWPTTDAIERRWIAHAGFDPAAVYPHREANATARRIEELAALLGIEVAPQEVPQRARPSEQAAERFAAAKEALKQHVNSLRRPVPELAAPPAEVASLLSEAEPVLAELVVLLAEAEAPRWELDLERGLESMLPNLLGHLSLHRLLTASTAEAARRGEADRARRRLDASWRLRESLSADPRLITQLVAHGELGNDLTVLRAFEGALPGWRERLEPLPLRERTGTALRLESWMLVVALRTGQFESELAARPAARFFVRPLARHGVAGSVDFIEHALARQRTEDLRSYDHDRFFEEEEARIPRWNVVARLLVPNFLDAWVRAARAELDVELTRRALEARELLRGGDLAALDALRGEHPSVVEGISWRYRIEPGEVAIEASDDLPVVFENLLPLEVRLRTR